MVSRLALITGAKLHIMTRNWTETMASQGAADVYSAA